MVLRSRNTGMERVGLTGMLTGSSQSCLLASLLCKHRIKVLVRSASNERVSIKGQYGK